MATLVRTAFILLVLCSPQNAVAAKVTLAWDPPTDGITTGYIVYFGTASGSYSQQVNVGFVTEYTVTGLSANTTYYFTVRAYDATGALSPPSEEVSTGPPPNKPPTVSVTSPTEGGSFLASGTISTQATASDDGSIQSVIFVLNGMPYGAPDTSAPYETTISGLVAGTYTLTAVATDDQLATSTSMPVYFTVTSAGSPGSRTNVALASNGAVAVASSSYSPAFRPEGANNGDRRGQSWGNGGGWHDATPYEFPDTLEIQFNGPKTISEIDVFSVQDDYQNPAEPTPTLTFTQWGLYSFEVEYWTGTVWQTVNGGSIAANNLVWRQIIFNPITTTKIRVRVNLALNANSRVVELEAWTVASPNSRTNVALASNGAVAGASSSHSPAFGPEGANNGDRRGQSWGNGGGWHDATPYDFPDTLEIQFNGPKTINEIDVFSVQDDYQNPAEPTPTLTFTQWGLCSFEVQYWTGTAWQTVNGGSIAGNNLVWRQILFDPITTTKIRVRVDLSLNAYSRLVELEAWTIPGGS